eukprot:3934963-Rhodomonas_salina.1
MSRVVITLPCVVITLPCVMTSLESRKHEIFAGRVLLFMVTAMPFVVITLTFTVVAGTEGEHRGAESCSGQGMAKQGTTAAALWGEREGADLVAQAARIRLIYA